MSGTRITDQQVRLYMNNRKHHSQKLAAAKSGISERTARRVEHDAGLPSQQPRRYWRSRPDPFADVWESEVVPLLRSAPKLKAITLLRKLQEDHPERFPDSMRRTLERHVSQWRALEGPNREVFFPQTYLPGARGLSDFTHMDKLCVTIGAVPFNHLLYHFVLAFSRWEYASVVDGGESFQALAAGLQNALWQAGGCPRDIGHALIDAGYRVLYTRTSEIVQKLQVARQGLQLPSALAKLDRFDLVILDDLSYVRKDQAETSVLFELIAERYERRSLLITANQPFSGWNDVFPDPGMTVAAIDRLVHHSTIFELNVESYRRRKASDKQNVRRRQLPNNHDEGAATTL